MIIEISVAVIALAFVILVIYLIIMIKTLRTTLNQLTLTLDESKRQLGELGAQAQKVIEHTNQISFDLKQKVEAFNPIFNAVENAGEILEHKSLVLKKKCLAFEEEEEEEGEKLKLQETEKLTTVAAILELGGIGIKLWQKLKRRR